MIALQLLFYGECHLHSPGKEHGCNRVQKIGCSIPLGNYHTVGVNQLSACSRENTANNGYHYNVNTLFCTVSCHSDVPFIFTIVVSSPAAPPYSNMYII